MYEIAWVLGNNFSQHEDIPHEDPVLVFKPVFGGLPNLLTALQLQLHNLALQLIEL